MTDSLRDLIAETIYRRYNGQTWTDLDLADALLADPTLAAIIDLAAVGLSNKNSYTDRLDPEQYVTVCRDLIAAHQAAMDARRIADALGYALTNAESDSNGDPVGPELDPAIAAWRGRSWRGLVSPEQAAHIREVLGPGIGDALKRTRPE